MALSKTEIGEIALKLLQKKIEKEGIYLRPKRVKRDVTKFAKKVGIPPCDAAEFVMIHLQWIYNKTIAQLQTITTKADKPKGE